MIRDSAFPGVLSINSCRQASLHFWMIAESMNSYNSSKIFT